MRVLYQNSKVNFVKLKFFEEGPHGKILEAEIPREPAVLYINADKPGLHNCRAGDGTGGGIEIGGNR